VVDDTEMNLTVIKSLLKRTEIQIDTAASGKEALSLADSNSYDAVFIDHMMPDMDGIETLHRLRDKDNCSRIPAVALTANAVSGAREMYLNAGFTDYLSKPIDGEVLEKMLARLLPEEKVSHGDGSPDSGGTEVSQENRPHDSFPEWLYSVEGMDAKEGLKNCGSAEGYISVLTVFYRTAGKKADEIESALGSNDIENYTIKVHALKSSARIIGAANLSKLAEMLENAGKEKNIDLISMETGALLKRYRNLGDKLSRLDPGDEDLPEIDPASMSEAYRTVAEIAQIMDYQMMDSLLKDIKGYRLPPEDKEKVALIEQMLTELNWDKIMEIAGGEG
jgi:CheY-like chemotaxis protein/HPt (histidine-containing phosphotransfer) domain-containing protein